jgi:streptogramin lyase
MSQTFVGSAGNHTFIGGSGTNTLDYSAATGAASVDLSADKAQNGFGGVDTVGNIQVVIGSKHGGSFKAGSGSETFVVTGGNNVISGTQPTITEFPVLPTANAEPFIITPGPDGNVWFSEFNVNKIGHLSLDGTLVEFSTPASPTNLGIPNAPSNTGGLAFDAQGNVWFTEVGNDKIGVMSPSGVLLHEYPLPETNPPSFALTHTITLGPDGNMWFAEVGTDKIGRITPNGTITEFDLPTAATRGPSTDFDAGSQPFDIITGPDGALWFTEFTGDKIGRITTSGQLTEFKVPANASTVPGFPHFGDPVSLVFGPDGAIWYTDLNGNAIGRMTTQGQVVEYTLPTPLCQPQYLVVGPDGAIWFTEQNSGKIGRITMDGQITEFAIPGPNGPGSFDFGLTVGPDGNLWFTEIVGHRVGRITAGSTLTVDYSHAPNAVTVNLPAGTAQNGLGGTDTLSDVQAIVGSAHDDTFISGGPQTAIGDSVTLTGGDGADNFVFTAAAFARGQSGFSNHVADYSLADGDQIDISALVSAAYAHGTGQPIDSLVRLVEDVHGGFARLQVDPDGVVNGANFATIAQLDGVHAGDHVNVVLDSTQPLGTSITTTGHPPLNDFNGDGTSDILLRNLSGGAAVWLIDNGQRTATPALPPATTDWHIAGTGDFDGNGTSDLLWHNNDGTTFTELLKNGAFSSGVGLPKTPADWTFSGTGDFNGDGTTDLLWHTGSGRNVIDLLSDGGLKSELDLPKTTSEWKVVGTGDFSNDGTADLLWHNNATGENFVELLSNGKFQSSVQLATTTLDWALVGTGDFNGDGSADILWRNDAGQNFVELLRDGHFQVGLELPKATAEWHVADIGDYNADGTDDVLWRSDSGVNFIEQLANGHFQSGVALPNEISEWHVVNHIGDLV